MMFPELCYCATCMEPCDFIVVKTCFMFRHLWFKCINASLVEDVALRRRVCLRLVTRMSYWYLQHPIKVKFCVKLRENASDTCAVLSEAHGEKVWKVKYFNGINGSNRIHISKSRMKIVLITFFEFNGAVHFEFLPQGQTVIQVHYVEIMKRLCKAVSRRRSELRRND